MKYSYVIATLVFLAAILSSCLSGGAPSTPVPQKQQLKVLAIESFLADLTLNVAGNRALVETLIPVGLDPHAFEPTPKDVRRIANSDVIVINGAAFEEWLDETLKNAGGDHQVVEASQGLTPRNVENEDHALDPHFWFDPILAIHYVENIRDGLSKADPNGSEIYTHNAQVYIASLKELDAWAVDQISQIPPQKRLMVTNHESFGYFADRYGFKVIGAVLPSVSTSASPSAKQIADLINAIKDSGARAIFLETGANPELAQQIAQETGTKIVTDLYTHSLSEERGPAATYLEMMRYNITSIVSALK